MILIRDAQIVDGTGKPPYRADLLLNRDKISAIGSFPRQDADKIINGNDAYLLPGFIDTDTGSDHYLTIFTNRDQKYFLIQGVTTIIGGQCGSSLAPLLYGSLESVRKWSNTDSINVNWHTMSEFLKNLSQSKIGVNFATLTGHSTVKRALTGNSLRNLTRNELEVFKKIIKDSFNQGSFGISVGLSYSHSFKTSFSELKALGNLAKAEEKIFSIHLRNEKEDLVKSVKEVIRLARETEAKIIINHLRPILGFEKEFEEALRLLDKANLDIHFGSYPSDTSIVSIYMFLPEQFRKGKLEGMLKAIRNSDSRRKIRGELNCHSGKEIIIAHAPNQEYLVGKTLKEFAEAQMVDLEEGILRLMEITNMRAALFYKNINIDFAIESLTHKKALVASSSPSLEETARVIAHERILNTFPKFLEIALQTKIMPIEKAVQKITSVPARIFGLKDRGEIKEGMIADLSLYKDGKIINTFVNGKLAVDGGEFNNNFTGEVLNSVL